MVLQGLKHVVPQTINEKEDASSSAKVYCPQELSQPKVLFSSFLHGPAKVNFILGKPGWETRKLKRAFTIDVSDPMYIRTQ